MKIILKHNCEWKRKAPGFTLLELLVVAGLMGAVTAVAVACLSGGGRTAARDAAVALLASRVTAARQWAVSRGAPVRLLVAADAAVPERFLRRVVLAVDDGGGAWRVVDEGDLLPEGVVLLPPTPLALHGPGAVQREGDVWTRPSDGGALRSTALRDYAGPEDPTLLGSTAWYAIHFSATGGAFAGDLIVAAGRLEGDSVPATVVCENPEAVAGLALSSYGVATFARGLNDF